MGAAVPFAGATMTGFGGAAATAGTVAAISAPIASVGASMMMNPAILSPGGGGLLAGFGTAFETFNKYSNIVAMGFSGLQAVGAYQRGQYLE